MTNPAHLFVSLPLCTRLVEYGLTTDTWASWREYVLEEKSQVYLVASCLDHKGLYQSQPLPEGELPPVYFDTPAYTIVDMLRCVPLFRLQAYDQSSYGVSSRFGCMGLDEYAGNEPLPDLVARKVLQLLERGVLTAEVMNEEVLVHPLILDKQ